jgi:hypothetical protein
MGESLVGVLAVAYLTLGIGFSLPISIFLGRAYSRRL